MEARRFDTLTKALSRGNVFKGLISGGTAVFASASAVSAQDDDTANAGNGGVATASANGGSVTIGDINTGFNEGNTIVVGDTGGGGDDDDKKDCYDCHDDDGGGGTVIIDGGTVTNSAAINISADGGVATADASGGDNNVAFAS